MKNRQFLLNQWFCWFLMGVGALSLTSCKVRSTDSVDEEIPEAQEPVEVAEKKVVLKKVPVLKVLKEGVMRDFKFDWIRSAEALAQAEAQLQAHCKANHIQPITVRDELNGRGKASFGGSAQTFHRVISKISSEANAEWRIDEEKREVLVFRKKKK